MLEVANHVNKVFHLITLLVLGTVMIKIQMNVLINVLLNTLFCNTFLQLYRPLNIRVMLVGLEVWNVRDHFDVSSNSDTTLNRFLEWRKTYLLPRKKHDNAQFVT